MLTDELVHDCILVCTTLRWLNFDKRVWPHTQQLKDCIALPPERRAAACKYLAGVGRLRRVTHDKAAKNDEYGWMYDNLAPTDRPRPSVPLRKLWRYKEKIDEQLICRDTGLRKPLTDMYTIL